MKIENCSACNSWAHFADGQINIKIKFIALAMVHDQAQTHTLARILVQIETVNAECL